MRTMLTAGLIAMFLAVLAIASGCEDSPITAAPDDQMYLVALPPIVHIDPDAPTAPMTSTIVATVVGATGVPKEGLLVFFSSTGGQLASNTQAVQTDANGNAYDLLTIDPGGPGDINVIATSTSLTDNVTVTNGACDDNPVPVAAFSVPTPTLNENGTKSVDLTSTSTDTLPGQITSYLWDCGNETSGTPTAATSCTYTVGTASTTYTIRLTVKDDGLGGSGPTYACQKTSTITHPVTIAP